MTDLWLRPEIRRQSISIRSFLSSTELGFVLECSNYHRLVSACLVVLTKQSSLKHFRSQSIKKSIKNLLFSWMIITDWTVTHSWREIRACWGKISVNEFGRKLEFVARRRQRNGFFSLKNFFKRPQEAKYKYFIIKMPLKQNYERPPALYWPLEHPLHELL